MKFGALYMESSRANQMKDEIRDYLPLNMLNSLGLLRIIHALTINDEIFMKYLHSCNLSYQIKLFSFL